MPTRIRSQRWSQQPQWSARLNLGNEYGARTMFFAANTGALRNVAAGSLPVTSGVFAAIDQGQLVTEVASAGGSVNYAEWSSAGVDLSGPYSAIIRIRRTAASSSSYDRIFHSNGNNTGNSRVGFFFTGSVEGANADKVYWLNRSSGGVETSTYPAPTPVASTTRYETYAVTHDGSNLRIYTDGVLSGTFACTTFPAAALPNPLRYGTDTSGSANVGAPFTVAYAQILRGALKVEQLRELQQNPWQILEPRRSWVPQTAAAGGSSTITAAAGSSTASTLAGSSTAAATAASAAGTSSSAAFAGASTAVATASAAPGVATAATLTGQAVTIGAVSAAAGAATASTLAGASSAAGTAAAASGATTASVLTGSSVAAATISGAAGVSTASALVGTAGGSIIVPAEGASSAQILVGSAFAVATMAAAGGASTASALVGSDASATIIPTMPPYITVFLWKRTA